jgi:magnesium transporter
MLFDGQTIKVDVQRRGFFIQYERFNESRGPMLSFYSSAAKGEIPVAPDAETIPPEVNWIDTVRPDAQEIAFLERALGFEVPTLASLSEIEASSRLRTEKDWLHLSIPMIYRAEGFMPALTPLGFILSKDLL